MTSPPRPHRLSVRLSLMLWNTGLLALALLSFCALCRPLVQMGLLSLLDRQLTTRTERMVHFWEEMPPVQREMLHAQLGRRTVGGGLLSFLGAPGSGTLEGFWDAVQTPTYRPRILTLDRRDYFSQETQAPFDSAAFARAAHGATTLSTVQVQGLPTRLFSTPVRLDGRIQAVVQVARDLSEQDRQVEAISLDLLLTIPFLLALSLLGGFLLTQRALVPIRTLQEATARIEAEDLAQRLPIQGHDEFAQLTQTINHMLARLEKAFAQQARFVADASHELRTPLTVLRGNTSLALARPRAPEEYREALERAQHTAETLSRLVEELLLLSQLDASQEPLRGESFALRAILQAAIEGTPGRELHPIALEMPASPVSPIAIAGNADLLTRLFANLLQNAVRHTPADRPITVTVSRQESDIRIDVADQGEGIPAEHLPYVCERFYRADAARSPHRGGSGLGLAICRSIVEAHGGSIRLESVAGQGTTVTVLLPSASLLLHGFSLQ